MIESYEFGRVTVDGKEYTGDIIVFPGWVNAGWWRREGHDLNIEDIESLLREKPDIIVVGTGINGMLRVPDRTRDYIASRGINLVVERTAKACELYNELSRNSKTVAALHVTC